MLAYSSIAHGGYLLAGLIAGDSVGKAAVLFYLAAYAVTNLGAFGIVALLATKDHPHDEVRDFAGLWEKRPAIAALMTVFLLSLGGFPPTAGFVAKWYIFSAAVEQQYYWLAIIGVLTSVVSVFYYLRIVVMMYMSDEKREAPSSSISPLATAGLALAVVGIFYLGILPTGVINLALQSIDTIF
jgi:NADH-quinone oxidoreductase subunit N